MIGMAARHFDLGRENVICTIFNDSLDLYRSRLEEVRQRGRLPRGRRRPGP
jgi:hypothetical protein